MCNSMEVISLGFSRHAVIIASNCDMSKGLRNNLVVKSLIFSAPCAGRIQIQLVR